MPEEFPIIGPAYANRSLPTNAQELVNMYLQTGGQGGRDHLTRTPGLELSLTASGSSCECAFDYNGLLHIIVGNTLYSIDGTTATSLGTISGTIRPDYAKYVATDGTTEVGIVRGSSGYVLSGTTLTKITDTDFPSVANTVTARNNQLIVSSDENKFYSSDVGNGLSWNGLWFERVTEIGDVVACIEDHGEVFVFGEYAAQVYDYILQGSALPFAKREGAKIEVGCLSRDSIAQLDNSFIFLGRTENGQGRFWRVQGYQPLNITAPALEEEMATYSRIDDAVAFSYYQAGHEFYVVTFPTAGKTWVYDAAIGNPQLAWHRRESYQLGRWRGNCHALVGTTHYIGDYANGNIYKMMLDVYDDNSDPMIAKRTFPHYPPGFYQYLKIGVETGVGLNSGQGSDPHVMLRWSDNDGRTYGTVKRRAFGKRGEFKTLVEFHGLGMTRKQRTFEVTCSDPVPFALYGAKIGFKPYGN